MLYDGLHVSSLCVLPLLYHRLFEWIFLNVHMEDLNDDTRAVYLRGLHEVIYYNTGMPFYIWFLS